MQLTSKIKGIKKINHTGTPPLLESVLKNEAQRGVSARIGV